ncbi:hypothetical protein KKF55_03525 [Patescibacteria group bacterium]|nr:hypothetical protein [Patescibacteria group bacterium]
MTFASIANIQSESTPQIIAIIIVVALIDSILKGFALWRSARMKKMWWFVTLLIVNSAGIFPLIYLIVTNKQYKTFKTSDYTKAPQRIKKQKLL